MIIFDYPQMQFIESKLKSDLSLNQEQNNIYQRLKIELIIGFMILVIGFSILFWSFFGKITRVSF